MKLKKFLKNLKNLLSFFFREDTLPPMFGPYMLTFLWSMTPFLELRASIPLGYLRFGLPLYESILVSIFGCIFSAILLILFLPHIVEFFERYIPFFDRIMKRIFTYTRTRHSQRIAILGEIALVTFVAIPLPGSGAWTGVLVSYLFGIPKKKSLFLISVGVIISSLIVALLTVAGREIWEVFTHFNEVVEVVAP